MNLQHLISKPTWRDHLPLTITWIWLLLECRPNLLPLHSQELLCLYRPWYKPKLNLFLGDIQLSIESYFPSIILLFLSSQIPKKICLRNILQKSFHMEKGQKDLAIITEWNISGETWERKYIKEKWRWIFLIPTFTTKPRMPLHFSGINSFKYH